MDGFLIKSLIKNKPRNMLLKYSFDQATTAFTHNHIVKNVFFFCFSMFVDVTVVQHIWFFTYEIIVSRLLSILVSKRS